MTKISFSISVIIECIILIVSTGNFPIVVSADSITASHLCSTATATSLTSALVGVGLDINFYIDENGDIYDGIWLVDNNESIFQTVMDKIYYVRWGNKYDDECN